MAKSKRKRAPKTVLKLPDLEQSKSAVLNRLTSASSERSYDHAICEFIVCLSKISKCLSAWELVFLHNSRRCSFFSLHSSQLCGRSSGRVLPSGSRTWLYAIKSACSTGLQESAQNSPRATACCGSVCRASGAI